MSEKLGKVNALWTLYGHLSGKNLLADNELHAVWKRYCELMKLQTDDWICSPENIRAWMLIWENLVHQVWIEVWITFPQDEVESVKTSARVIIVGLETMNEKSERWVSNWESLKNQLKTWKGSYAPELVMESLTSENLWWIDAKLLTRALSRATSYFPHFIACITPENINTIPWGAFEVVRKNTLLNPDKDPADKVEVQRRKFERMIEDIRMNIDETNELTIDDCVLDLLWYWGEWWKLARSLFPDDYPEWKTTQKRWNEPSSWNGLWKFLKDRYKGNTIARMEEI